MNDEYALITGGSGGIGYELAKCFAKENVNLILVSRDINSLNKAAESLAGKFKIDIKVISKDLSISGSAEELYSEVKVMHIKVTHLINNAGFGKHSVFHEMDDKDFKGMMELNMVSLAALTKNFLPDLISNKNGGIINIASTAAFAPGPYLAIYYATKAFVLSFTEAIAEELKGTGVQVMCACPGPVETNFFKRASIKGSRLLKVQKVISAEIAAEIIYKRYKRKRVLSIIGLSNFISIQVSRLSPRILNRKTIKWLNKKRK